MSDDNKPTTFEKGPDAPADGAESCSVKADVAHRLLAKFIDLLIFSALALILEPVGLFAGLTYILIADGFQQGRSVGKKIIGLRTIVIRPDAAGIPCRWKDSMVRNGPIAIALFLSSFYFWLGFFGFILFLGGLLIIIFELYFIITDDRGLRLGDIIANSQVLEP